MKTSILPTMALALQVDWLDAYSQGHEIDGSLQTKLLAEPGVQTKLLSISDK